jgi:D-alanyl-D-alanine dipeptidase
LSSWLSLTDPHIAHLPVNECGEPLVDVRAVESIRTVPSPDDPFGVHAHLRRTVVDRLVTAQSLLPRGVRLLLVEGYRPLAKQRDHFAGYVAELSRANPDWSTDRVRQGAERYCTPLPSAPHLTGAAADLTLCGEDGTELPMGTPVHAGPAESAGAVTRGAPGISDTERANRRVLYDSLSAAGLVNLPTAWWHWSYGDRFWCHVVSAPAARYGQVDPPSTLG